MSLRPIGPESAAPATLNNRFGSSHGLPRKKQGYRSQRRVEGLYNVANGDFDIWFLSDREIRDFQRLQYGLGSAADGAAEKSSIAHVSPVAHEQQDRKTIEPPERLGG